ncbi:hypothetical protein T484DRAFT_1871709, partial [Baffinella frigidus]
ANKDERRAKLPSFRDLTGDSEVAAALTGEVPEISAVQENGEILEISAVPENGEVPDISAVPENNPDGGAGHQNASSDGPLRGEGAEEAPAVPEAVQEVQEVQEVPEVVQDEVQEVQEGAQEEG